MDIKEILKELKGEIIQLSEEKFGAVGKNIKTDLEDYFEASKAKIEKWGQLFLDGRIDKDELEWLLNSQKDILVLKALQSAGISRIKLGHFKNKIIGVVLSKLVGLVV